MSFKNSYYIFKKLEKPNINLRKFTQLSLWIVNFYVKSIFCRNFIVYLHVWIQKAPEYGSNTDPDPQHCFYSKEMFR